jgi:hypothetical protein
VVIDGVNLGFLDRSRYFAFKLLLSYPHVAECSSRNMVSQKNLIVLGIEPEHSVCCQELWPLGHIGSLSTDYNNLYELHLHA